MIITWGIAYAFYEGYYYLFFFFSLLLLLVEQNSPGCMHELLLNNILYVGTVSCSELTRQISSNVNYSTGYFWGFFSVSTDVGTSQPDHC